MPQAPGNGSPDASHEGSNNAGRFDQATMTQKTEDVETLGGGLPKLAPRRVTTAPPIEGPRSQGRRGVTGAPTRTKRGKVHVTLTIKITPAAVYIDQPMA